MLARRDQDRPHFTGPTQLGENRRELDAFGTSTDDEGEGGHLNRGREELKGGHEGRRERQIRGSEAQRLGGSEGDQVD